MCLNKKYISKIIIFCLVASVIAARVTNILLVTVCFALYVGGLTNEALISAAQSMEEVYFTKGDVIIEQDDIGDSFFVLEDGRVSVTVRRLDPIISLFSLSLMYRLFDCFSLKKK